VTFAGRFVDYVANIVVGIVGIVVVGAAAFLELLYLCFVRYLIVLWN
jgi:uncharacterized protein (DUF983 family)